MTTISEYLQITMPDLQGSSHQCAVMTKWATARLHLAGVAHRHDNVHAVKQFGILIIQLHGNF